MRTLRIGRYDAVPEHAVVLQAANGKSILFDLENGEIHIFDCHRPLFQGTLDILIGPVNLDFVDRETPCHTPT